MRYIRRLESRDLALNEAMIPLGSCTMKLNAASEMIPITWPEANSLHPFVPADQSEGIREMLSVLSDRLAKITGFAAVSLQPKCDERGNIDMADLKSQAEAHKDNLSCIMVTYPSTHGVYEQTIKELCDIVHANGGQVYMDGANMNAQVGLTCPGCGVGKRLHRRHLLDVPLHDGAGRPQGSHGNGHP